MKFRKYLISFLLHFAVFLLSYFIVFKTPQKQIILGYGNVQFTTVKKNRYSNKGRFKKRKIRHNGEGEAIEEKNINEISVPSENNKNFSSYLNGKFSIDFMGKRKRAIYSYVLPEYPAGVEKEANIVLKISIDPDGSVSNVFPLIKADTRLEIAAIDAVKNWRFEPLPSQIPQIKQEAIIVFPYRLH